MELIEGATQITKSDSKDKCLVIVGGTHGNEPAGVRAINMITTLTRDGEWTVEGNVFGLVGNPKAVEQSSRFCEENLNRAFNGHVSESYEGKRAREIRGWFEKLVKEFKQVYLIDLHSVSIGEVRIVIFSGDDERSEEWAKAISPIPFRFGSPEKVLPGTLMGGMEKLGGIAVSIECGNHASEVGVVVAMEHMENALLSLGMLKEQRVTFRGKVTYDGQMRTYELMSPIKPSEGFCFDRPVFSEMPLKKGELFARDKSGEHRAPQDCFVIMPSKDPQPEDFDAGFLAVRTD